MLTKWQEQVKKMKAHILVQLTLSIGAKTMSIGGGRILWNIRKKKNKHEKRFFFLNDYGK